MLRGKRGTFGHRPSCCVEGVALGNIVLATIFSHRRFFFGRVFALERARLPGIVVMICIILCSKVMHQTVFQSDPATACGLPWKCHRIQTFSYLHLP